MTAYAQDAGLQLEDIQWIVDGTRTSDANSESVSVVPIAGVRFIGRSQHFRLTGAIRTSATGVQGTDPETFVQALNRNAPELLNLAGDATYHIGKGAATLLGSVGLVAGSSIWTRDFSYTESTTTDECTLYESEEGEPYFSCVETPIERYVELPPASGAVFTVGPSVDLGIEWKPKTTSQSLALVAKLGVTGRLLGSGSDDARLALGSIDNGDVAAISALSFWGIHGSGSLSFNGISLSVEVIDLEAFKTPGMRELTDGAGIVVSVSGQGILAEIHK